MVRDVTPSAAAAHTLQTLRTTRRRQNLALALSRWSCLLDNPTHARTLGRSTCFRRNAWLRSPRSGTNTAGKSHGECPRVIAEADVIDRRRCAWWASSEGSELASGEAQWGYLRKGSSPYHAHCGIAEVYDPTLALLSRGFLPGWAVGSTLTPKEESRSLLL